MRTAIVVVVAVAACKISDFIPYFIRRFALQPAFFNVDNFVEHALNVESKSFCISAFLVDFHISRVEPATVGECIFQLVAVELCIVGTKYPIDRDIAYSSYARNLVAYLLLLVVQLLFVGKHLPLATAALLEMLAERLNPVGRRLDNFQQLRFGIVLATARKHHVHYIAGDDSCYKYHKILAATYSHTFGGNVGYQQVLYNLWFLLRHLIIY